MATKNNSQNVSNFIVLGERKSKDNNIVGEVFKNDNGNLGLLFQKNGTPITELKGLDMAFINVNFLKNPVGKKVGIITMNERKAK